MRRREEGELTATREIVTDDVFNHIIFFFFYSYRSDAMATQRMTGAKHMPRLVACTTYTFNIKCLVCLRFHDKRAVFIIQVRCRRNLQTSRQFQQTCKLYKYDPTWITSSQHHPLSVITENSYSRMTMFCNNKSCNLFIT